MTTDLHPADLPALLKRRGIELSYRLVIDDPEGSLDDDLLAKLGKHKPLLVEALARADAFGNPKIDYADVLTWDRDGFDWADGLQKLGLAPVDPSEFDA